MRTTAIAPSTRSAVSDWVAPGPATTSKPALPPVVAGSVVFGTDFSPRSDVIAEVAGEFARRLGVQLALTHAVEMPRTLARDARASRWLLASRKRTLRADATALRKTGLRVVGSVRPGRTDEVLLRTATYENAQLIVVAPPERRRMRDRLRGTVAGRAAARTRAPLLMVRDPEPLGAWLRGKRPLKIFVAYNSTATADAALRWVKQLTRLGPSEVVLGYVNQPIEDYLRIGARGPLPFGANPPDVLAVLERDMKARARALLGDIPVHCRVEPDGARTHARLAELAREEGADLLVVGSRQHAGLKRLWHESVSRDLLNEATMNVAIVPLTKTSAGRALGATASRHVLVATDFSASGNAAIPHALALLPEGGLLTLMHVASLPPAVSDQARRDFGRESKLSPAAICSLSNRLRELVPTDIGGRGIFAQVEVVAAADVGRAISQAAERLGVDAICLGSDNRSEIGRALLGSVTRTVCSLTRRPLLIVSALRR